MVIQEDFFRMGQEKQAILTQGENYAFHYSLLHYLFFFFSMFANN